MAQPAPPRTLSAAVYFPPGSALFEFRAYMSQQWPLHALVTTLLAPLERYVLIRQAESALNTGGQALLPHFPAYLKGAALTSHT
jgi:hypothetical protein